MTRQRSATLLMITALLIGLFGVSLGLTHVTRLQTDCGTGLTGLRQQVAQKDESQARKARIDQIADEYLAALNGSASPAETTVSEHRLADACQPAIDSQRNLALIVLVGAGVLLAIGYVASRPA